METEFAQTDPVDRHPGHLLGGVPWTPAGQGCLSESETTENPLSGSRIANRERPLYVLAKADPIHGPKPQPHQPQ